MARNRNRNRNRNSRRNGKLNVETLETRQLMAANTGLYFAPVEDQNIVPTGTPAQAYADLNGDGYIDMLRSTGIGPNALAVWMGRAPGNGSNGGGAGTRGGGGPSGYDEFENPVFYPGGTNSPKILTGDVTHDGKLDVLHVNGNEKSITVLRGNGNGTLVHHSTVGLGDLVPTDVSMVDWNRHGKLDLAIVGYQNNFPLKGVVVTMVGNGDGTFGQSTTYLPSDATAFTQAFSVASGDFNGDNFADLVVTHMATQQGYQIYMNNGNGTFARQQIQMLSDFPAYVTTADLNLDGRSDFAFSCVATQSGSSVPTHDVAIAMNNGNGSAFTLSYWEVDTDRGYIASPGIAVADMDGDNKQDIVFAGVQDSSPGTSFATILRGNDAGNFTRGRKHRLGVGATNIATPDVSRDGARDLMVTTAGSVVMSRSLASFTSISWQMPASAPYTGQPTFAQVEVSTTEGSMLPVNSVTWYRASDPLTPIAAPTDVGNYVVHAFFAGDEFHPSASGSMSYAITPVMPSVAINVNPATTYNAQPVPVTATGIGVLGETLGSATVQVFLASDTTFSNPLAGGAVNAGNYVARATYNGSGNYGAGVGTASFRIDQASPSVSIQLDRWLPFTGAPVQPTGSVTGVNGENLGSPTFSYYLTSDPGFTNPLPGAPSAMGGYFVLAQHHAAGNYAYANNAQAFFIIAAESLVVTTTADELDANASPFWGSGVSLREAVRYANQKPGADTITFAPSLAGQVLTLSNHWSNATPYETGSALSVSDGALTINGPSSGPGITLQIDPTREMRHLLIHTSGSATINHLTLTGGKANASGFSYGGAVWNFGSLTVRNSTFTNNHAGSDGGAIHSTAGSARLEIQNSTFTGNSAFIASAIATGAAANEWEHMTIVDNVGGGSGAIDIYQTQATMRNSIVARNAAEGAVTWLGNGSGAFTAASTNNLVAGTSWAGLDASTNQIDVAPASLKLGTLADNGGPTKTIALLTGSPAVNAGIAISGVTTDQRGVARPQGFASDIGAFERAVTGATISTQAYEWQSRQAITFTFNTDATVDFSRSDITVRNTTTNQTINTGSLSFNNDGTLATLVLTNQLPNGDYEVTTSIAFGAAPLSFFVLAGDADHNGVINFDDYARIDFGFNGGLTGFDNGDFNYDGVINFDDYAIIDLAFNQQNASLPAIGDGSGSGKGARGGLR